MTKRYLVQIIEIDPIIEELIVLSSQGVIIESLGLYLWGPYDLEWNINSLRSDFDKLSIQMRVLEMNALVRKIH